MLNSIDHEKATFFARQAALERFDPELAKVFFVQSNDESVRARLQLAEALVGAEREFLAAQSDSIYDGTYIGSYGSKMRNIIAAEYRTLEERRQLARKQNISTAVAVIALAGAVYGAVASAASTAAVITTSGALLAGSGWALHESLETKTESKEVNRYFLARMAPAFDRQMSVQMEWLESKEVITARGFAEFQKQDAESLPVEGHGPCRSVPMSNASSSTRALGRTDAGTVFVMMVLPRGRGYGLIMNDRGDTVEFIGETQKGLASGAGGMIVHRRGQVGATYYEGGFKNGLPDGVVRVEEPGQLPRTRLV